MQFINNKMMQLLFLLSFLIVGLFLKFSLVFGSSRFFFSGINFFVPLFGMFFNFPWVFGCSLLFFVLKQVIFGSIITLGIPTFLGTTCFAVTLNQKNKKSFYGALDFLLRVVLPVLSMIIFSLHPVGREAFLYSFYWFIPIIFYFTQKFGFYRSVFSAALSATFVTHAVGSIIWLFVFSLTSQQWIALIPMVAVERLIFASGITLGFWFLKKLFIVDNNFCYKRSFYLN